MLARIPAASRIRTRCLSHPWQVKVLLGIWAQWTIARNYSRLTCRKYLKTYQCRLACVSYIQKAQKLFTSMKADLKRTLREYYDKSSRELHVPDGKQVCVRRPPSRSRLKGPATRFIRRFDGLYIVTRHVHGRQDLLRLRHKFIQDELETVNIEKIIVVSDELSDALPNYEDQPHNSETVNRSELPKRICE